MPAITDSGEPALKRSKKEQGALNPDVAPAAGGSRIFTPFRVRADPRDTISRLIYGDR